MEFLLRIQILLFLRHLHDIAQGTHGAGDNGNLLYRLRILLQGAHQGVAHLMVGHNPALLLAEDPVLLLLAHQNQLDSLEEILLGHGLPALLDGGDGRLIHHIGQVCADSAGGGQGDLVEIDGLIQLYVLTVHAQNLHAALQIRLVHDNPPVKTAGTEQCRVKDLRAVGGCHNQKSLGRVKSVHLGKQLV